MRKYLIILLLFFATFCFGQSDFKLNKDDSTKLSITWTKFSKALLTMNFNEIKKLSLKNVYCLSCIDTLRGTSIVNIDKFVNYLKKFIQNSALISMVKSENKKYYLQKYGDFIPDNLNLKKNDEFILYNIMFESADSVKITPDKKIELSFAYIFQFVKQKQKFVFYGFDILP